jgi:hypothetical protein
VGNRSGGKRVTLRKLVVLAGLGVMALGSTARAQNYPVQTAPLAVSSTTTSPGGSVQISGSGFVPGTTVQLLLFSSPVSLGTVQANGAGAITASVTIPANTPPGQHTLQAVGQAGSGGTLTLMAQIMVAGSGAQSSGLASTGAQIGLIAGVGVALVVAGFLITAGSRRRRRQVFY